MKIMKTTVTAALALSMFVFGAFAKNAPKQDAPKTDSTKSTVVKKHKGQKKSTTSVVAKPAAAVTPVAK
jgi:hypothetical protein